MWSALRRATQDKRASFLGLGRVPRRGSQIPLHNLCETTQGAKGRPDTWAWLAAAEIPPGEHSFCLWFPSSGRKKGILRVSISYALGWASPPGVPSAPLIWYTTALSHHGLLCRCTERHRHCPRSHSKSMLMPRARPSCPFPHLLGSALEEMGGLHCHTGCWALCCDCWDVNTLTAIVVWGSQEHSSA